MRINGALVWGFALNISLILGVVLATYRRDGRFSVKTLIKNPQPVPPAYVVRALRRDGARGLLRADVMFVFIFYTILVVLLGTGIGITIIQYLAS